MTDGKPHDDDLLESLFSEGRAGQLPPNSDLMARVLADADRVQPRVALARKPLGLWTQCVDMLGGWPTLGGLVAAGVAGLWVGMVPPAGVDSLTAMMLGTSETVTFAPDATFFAFDEDLTDG